MTLLCTRPEPSLNTIWTVCTVPVLEEQRNIIVHTRFIRPCRHKFSHRSRILCDRWGGGNRPFEDGHVSRHFDPGGVPVAILKSPHRSGGSRISTLCSASAEYSGGYHGSSPFIFRRTVRSVAGRAGKTDRRPAKRRFRSRCVLGLARPLRRRGIEFRHGRRATRRRWRAV